MFETSLVESTSVHRQRSRWPLALSVVAQAFLTAVFLAWPLLHPEALSLAGMHEARLLPPPPLPAPPTPHLVRPVHVNAVISNAMTAPLPRAAVLSSITRTTGNIPTPILATDINLQPASGNPFSAADAIGAPVARTVGVAVVGTPSASRTRISTGVSAGLLLSPITPSYPRIAQVARVQGTVIVDAIITKTGAIASARIVSGSPMLQGAAIEAVRSAHYRPFLLNGEPTEVETTISIVFHLAS